MVHSSVVSGTELLQKLMPDRRSAFRSLEPRARKMSLLSAQKAVFRGFRACGLCLTIDDALRPMRGAHCSILTIELLIASHHRYEGELQQKSLWHAAAEQKKQAPLKHFIQKAAREQ